MNTQTDKQQIEYSKEAKVLAAQYRAIGNPAFSMGKLCTICNGPVLNASKVLTCQDCRHDQHLSSASVVSDSPTSILCLPTDRSPNIASGQANRSVLFVMSRKQNTAALFNASCFEHLQAMFRVGISLPDGTHADGIGRCRNASQFAIKCARGGTRIQCYDANATSD